MNTRFTRRQACTLLAASFVPAVVTAQAQQDPPDDGTWSRDPSWYVLRRTRLLTEEGGAVSARIAPEVKALAGRELVISGFILPLEPAVESKHFLLSRYSPDCPFCPAGAPNEIIEVFAGRAMRQARHIVYLRGTFDVQNNMEAGLFYRLNGAVVA